MIPLKHYCVNQPHLASRDSSFDELLILFLLLLLYKYNELLILSSSPHFLLWLCMPLLHCLYLLSCTALGRAQAHPEFTTYSLKFQQI